MCIYNPPIINNKKINHVNTFSDNVTQESRKLDEFFRLRELDDESIYENKVSQLSAQASREIHEGGQKIWDSVLDKVGREAVDEKKKLEDNSHKIISEKVNSFIEDTLVKLNTLKENVAKNEPKYDHGPMTYVQECESARRSIESYLEFHNCWRYDYPKQK
ncbi:MAG: hypothetical protein Edafosvirus1_131 [Edafosvirus sp.]|uniref:Uncharacterized protein n=1 Tax=Edafosvirus sp. TaxID=2487765 RepID=A0A3G4ZSC7_9VIRU|nr:MAG: hypothetical protein Edafosvirus1_131 [Edafosvirus sp.]